MWWNKGLTRSSLSIYTYFYSMVFQAPEDIPAAYAANLSSDSDCV